MRVEQLLEKRIEPVYEPQSVEDAIQLLNRRCKDALWMLKENMPIWRGDSDIENALKNGFAIADARKSFRKSANTSNYYTLIFDNHPKMKGWPKRSQSFICSTSQSYAREFGKINAVIPFDGVKIGATNQSDIWGIMIKLFGEKNAVNEWNSYFDYFKLSDKNWESFCNTVKTIDENKFLKFFGGYYTFSTVEREKFLNRRQNFLNEIIRAYSPEATRMSLHTTADLKGVKGEMWTSGPCVFITENMWRQIRATYLKGIKRGN